MSYWAARVADLHARLERAEAERDERRWRHETTLKAETVLEEAAKEFERQAKAATKEKVRRKRWGARHGATAFEAKAQAFTEAALHLREKQAALKGGGPGGK